MLKFCIFLFFLVVPLKSTTPEQQFGNRYKEAFVFYKHNKNRIKQIVEQEQGDKRMVLSVGFPELIRYSMWKDYFETKANEIRYIKNEPASNLFSIGRFQIKPTFIEKIEHYLLQEPTLAISYNHLYNYPKALTASAIREERIRRLKSWQWQLRYITAFTKIVEHRFNLSNMTADEKIGFLSSAYNHDFLCDSLEIDRWIKIKSFPYGMRYGNPFSYAEVAVFFYQNDYSRLYKE
jgi:hypothetical protein